MATINAYKMDGLGNDFLIIDRRKSSVNLSKKQIIDFADRKNIGFDQLIYIEKELDQYVPITIFNSDGNEVDACGNGSRCIIKLLPLIDSKSSEEYDKNSKALNHKDEVISFKCELQENLQKAMKKFVEDHPNWDQYRILQAAIAGFLKQKGFQNRDLTRLYIGNMFSMNFKD